MPDRNIAGRDGQYPCRSVPLRCYASTQETARQVKSETRHPLGSAMRLQLAPTERLGVDGNGRAALRSDWAGAGMDDLRARPQIIESTFDRVRYRFTTKLEYHIVWG